MTDPIFLIIDLFCGAGGYTEGAEQSGLVEVIIGINHDAKAIESHAANHPETVHMTEDIRTVKMKPLIDILNAKRAQYPDAHVLLHASLEWIDERFAAKFDGYGASKGGLSAHRTVSGFAFVPFGWRCVSDGMTQNPCYTSVIF